MEKNVKLFDKNHFLILKAIAIIAIMIGHVGNFSGKTWFTPLGGFGVAIFLFCSGYGLSVSAKNGGVDRYWTKKFINVYVPFFIIEVIAALILNRNFKTFILDIAFIDISHPYGWYMQYIFICYLLFYIAFKFIKNQKSIIVVFLLLGILSFFIFKNLQAEQALSFAVGIAAANYEKIKQIQKTKLFILGLVLIIIGISFLAIKQMPNIRALNHYVITLLNLIIKLFTAIGVVFISYSLSVLFGFLTPVGKISYELYLVHGYVIVIVSKNIFKNFVLNSFIFLLVVLFISWIFYLINSQIKKLLNKINI